MYARWEDKRHEAKTTLKGSEIFLRRGTTRLQGRRRGKQHGRDACGRSGLNIKKQTHGFRLNKNPFLQDDEHEDELESRLEDGEG